jgi:hypothetical protein
MVKHFKPMALCNLGLEGLDPLIFKFDDLPAPKTDQMVVVLPLRHPFVANLSVVKAPLCRQPQAGEKLERPVDGGVADLRVRFGHLGIDFSQVLMAFRVEEDVKNLLSLFGVLTASLRDHRSQCIFFHRGSVLKLIFNFILSE